MLMPSRPPCSRSSAVILSTDLLLDTSGLIRCASGMKAVQLSYLQSRVQVTGTVWLVTFLSCSRSVPELGVATPPIDVIRSPERRPSCDAGLFGSVAGSQAFGALVVA